jgi:hypothetical protein
MVTMFGAQRIQQLVRQQVHVVRAARGLGQQARQVVPGFWVGVLADLALVAQHGRELARPVQRVRVGLGDHVHDAGPAAVRLGAAEPFHVHVLAGHRAHHVRAGDEDAARS